MKMAKTLLLGTAAGFVAVAGAQAADMPVKAAAVQFVKICNLYGDGFYYLPGTDICVKIGGYVRFETSYGAGSSMTNWGPFGGLGAGSIYNTRSDGADWLHRNRAYISMDTRQQTEYGVLRTYFNMGVNTDSPAAPAANINRAFIQFAGFTVGLAQSFFDFYSVPISSYFGTPSSDTGDSGWRVAAYTQNWGNGITTTVSLEEPRRTQVWNTNLVTNVFTGAAVGATSAPFGLTDQFVLGSTVNANTGTATIKERMPDLVTAWRIEQAWGAAQVMFAAHDVSGSYYADPQQLPAVITTLGTNPPGANGLNLPIGSICANQGIATQTQANPTPGVATVAGGTLTGSQLCGHPADKVGWAAGIGSKHNIIAPWSLGDYFQWQFTYARGATRYVVVTQSAGNGSQGNNPAYFSGATLGYGFWSDGVYSTATGDIRLTTSWGVNAAYDHFWTKAFRTSIYGSYLKVNYDSDANAAICAQQNLALPTQSGTTGAITSGGALSGIAGCNNDWGIWTLGSRTQYNFTPAMYVGLDVLYWKLLTASPGTAFYTAIAPSAVPSAQYAINNQQNINNVMFRVRFHRDILP